MKVIKKPLFMTCLICAIILSSGTLAFADECDYDVMKAQAAIDFMENDVDAYYSYILVNGSGADLTSIMVQSRAPEKMTIEEMKFIDSESGKSLAYTEQEGYRYLIELEEALSPGQEFTLGISNAIKIDGGYDKKLKVGIPIPQICGSVKMPQGAGSFDLTIKMPEVWSISSSFPNVYAVNGSDLNEHSASLSNIPGVFQAQLLTTPGGIKNDTILNIVFPLFLLVGIGVVMFLVRVQIKQKETTALEEEKKKKE